MMEAVKVAANFRAGAAMRQQGAADGLKVLPMGLKPSRRHRGMRWTSTPRYLSLTKMQSFVSR
jgi:hypothetical protein